MYVVNQAFQIHCCDWSATFSYFPYGWIWLFFRPWEVRKLLTVVKCIPFLWNKRKTSRTYPLLRILNQSTVSILALKSITKSKYLNNVNYSVYLHIVGNKAATTVGHLCCFCWSVIVIQNTFLTISTSHGCFESPAVFSNMKPCVAYIFISHYPMLPCAALACPQSLPLCLFTNTERLVLPYDDLLCCSAWVI